MSSKGKENKMGVMPVNQLLLNMSLPMMGSMLVQALYNIVDSVFVAKLSENALTAVSLAFPIQTLLIALGTGTGVGVNSLLSKQLGEGDLKQVSKTAMNGIFLAVMNFLVFVIVGIVGVRPFYASQVKGADPEIMSFGIQYLTIVCVCSFGLYAQLIFEKLLQSTGKTLYSMITQGVGAVINIFLDPVLIFGLFGMPKLGVAGAAIATVIGQIVGGMLGFAFNIKANKEITLSVKGFRPDGNTIANIYKVGVPAIIMQAIGSVMTYGMNMILITFSSTATAVFGVYFKLQSFFFMPVFGLNNGLIPIVAYNPKSRIIYTQISPRWFQSLYLRRNHFEYIFIICTQNSNVKAYKVVIKNTTFENLILQNVLIEFKITIFFEKINSRNVLLGFIHKQYRLKCVKLLFIVQKRLFYLSKYYTTFGIQLWSREEKPSGQSDQVQSCVCIHAALCRLYCL